MKFDLHVHTNISPCSQLPLEDIIVQAKERGLSGVCITDHDTMDIRHFLQEGMQDNGLCVIFGMEYATSEGDFLLFGPYEQLQTGLAAPELLRHVEQTGGVAVAAHPFRSNRPTREYLVDHGLCSIVEGINGRNHQHENDSVGTWRERYGVKQVGGSDAHTLGELGLVTTRFPHPIRNRAELIQALKNGSYAPERN
ncbi:MAG: PHP domain-containing protein [Proteobacteria bacterium]|nr:PHP domain-containing protein [Pseudomonadota bacterium]MBU4296779.1 PHP domain-containing protein [Pseudomonadota bacterium]MCG2748267.1 PHP domain-containing protein [Desulfobulbaceae bacterium]